MKIALIQLPHFYSGGFSRPPATYPLGLGYIASILRNNDIGYESLDLWMLQAKVNSAVKITSRIDCNVFGISAYSTQYAYLKDFSLKLKQIFPHIPIICGGAGVTFNPELILKYTGVDICVIGEGEETIVDLLRNLNNPDVVKGIVFKDEKGEIRKTEPRPQIRNLLSIPPPDRELFDHEQYIRNMSKHKISMGLRGTNIISGRGCPYNCNFCSLTFAGCRLRPVDDVIDEISWLKDRFKTKYIAFNDELTIINKNRTLTLCRKIKPLNIKWQCQGRINAVDEELLLALKEAGCRKIGYGVEAISQSILDNMNKEIKADSIIPAIEMTKRIGIQPIIQYMSGYYGENDETLNNTEEFFRMIDHPYVGFTTTPLPGSTLYRQCLDKGLIKDEEEYLMHLDSGYNIDKPRVNMTDFSDREFVLKKRGLRQRVNAYYFKRHPVKGFIHSFEQIISIFKLAFANPRYFVYKVKERLRLGSLYEIFGRIASGTET